MNLRFLLRNGILRYWQRIKREVVGEKSNPSKVVSPCLSMLFQVVQLLSEPGSFTLSDLVFSVGSNMCFITPVPILRRQSPKKLKRCL